MEKKIEPKINKYLEEYKIQKNVEENLDFKKIYESLLRRKRLLFLSASLVFTLGVLSSINQRIRNPIFRGAFSILISEPISTTSQLSLRNKFSSAITSQPEVDIATLIEVLKSPNVLSDIASKYKLTTKSLANSIDINSVFNKSGKAKGVLKISIDSNDPKKLKKLLNDVSKAFIKASILERQKKLLDGISFLSIQEPILKKDVITIQTELLNLRKKYNLITPEDTAVRLKNMISDYAINIDKINIDLKKLKKVKTEIKEGNLSVVMSKESFENDTEIGVEDTEQSKLTEITELREKISKAKLTYKNDSNRVLSLERKLEILTPEIINYQLEVINNKENSLINRKQNYLNEVDNLQNEFKTISEIQKEYDEIELKLEYALSRLDSLTSAKEDFQLSLAQTSIPWKIIRPPLVGSTPIKPSLPYSFATSLVAGILIGSILALIRERFDNVYHNDDEVKKSFNIPILGTIPYFSALKDVRGTKKNVLKIMEDPFLKNTKDKEENVKNKNYESFIIQEAFRNFFTNVRFIDDKKKTHSLLLTSSIPSEGKSLLNIILAKTIADLGLNVLLIDCDLRKPQVHQRLGMNNLKGFSDLFFDKNYLWTNALKPVKNYKNWDVITSGTKIIDPIRILSSDKLENLMNDISTENKYDFIIYDSPPALAFSDSIFLSKHTDGVLLAVSLNNVNKDIPVKVIDRLNSSGIDILGLVTNQIKYTSFVDESNSDYYNDYYNTDDDKDKDEDSLDIESNSKLIFKIRFFKEKISNFLNKVFNWIDK